MSFRFSPSCNCCEAECECCSTMPDGWIVTIEDVDYTLEPCCHINADFAVGGVPVGCFWDETYVAGAWVQNVECITNDWLYLSVNVEPDDVDPENCKITVTIRIIEEGSDPDENIYFEMVFVKTLAGPIDCAAIADLELDLESFSAPVLDCQEGANLKVYLTAA